MCDPRRPPRHLAIGGGSIVGRPSDPRTGTRPAGRASTGRASRRSLFVDELLPQLRGGVCRVGLARDLTATPARRERVDAPSALRRPQRRLDRECWAIRAPRRLDPISRCPSPRAGARGRRSRARVSMRSRRTASASTWAAIPCSQGSAEPCRRSRKRARPSQARANVSAVRSLAPTPTAAGTRRTAFRRGGRRSPRMPPDRWWRRASARRRCDPGRDWGRGGLALLPYRTNASRRIRAQPAAGVVRRASIAGKAASASARTAARSSSWIGCGTNTMR